SPAAFTLQAKKRRRTMSEAEQRDGNELTEEMQARIREELAEGEQIVWAARPLPGTIGVGCGVKAVAILGLVPTAAGVGLLLWAVEARQVDERFGVGLAL